MALSLGGIGVIHLPEGYAPPIAVPTVPDLSSVFKLVPKGGVVLDGYLTTQTVGSGLTAKEVAVLDRFAPNAATIALLTTSGSGSSGWKPPADMTVFHTVPYLSLPVPQVWSTLYNNPVTPPPGSSIVPKVYSQYRQIKPTMYSGLMRVLAQVVMGYGRLSPPSKALQISRHTTTVAGDTLCWCGEKHYTPSAAHPTDPNKVYRTMEDYSMDDTSTPDEDKLLGSLNYWFHWSKTHGVYRTTNGRLFLIQISAEGVFAMRLPVMAGTGEDVPESLKAYFTDMPLGYSFPKGTYTAHAPGEAQVTNTSLDEAVAKGWVKQLLTAAQLAPFYRLNPTYAECGWAFSASGKSVDNVGWHIPLPKPYDYPQFEHWHIDITGGEAGELYEYSHCANGFDAAMDSLRANITKAGGGHALDISQYNKPFKIPKIDPDTGLPGVVSFDMLPRGWSDQGPPEPIYLKAVPTYPVSDTVVHVFYDSEELVWVRFFNPMNTAKSETTNYDDRTEERYPTECMVLGSFTWGSSSHPKALPKGFYSNRLDPRQMIDDASVDMVSNGQHTWSSPYMGITYSFPYPPRLFGYQDSNGFYHGGDGQLGIDDFEPAYTSMVGSPWAAKRHCFHVHVKGESVSGQYYAYSCALPLTDREAAFMCERKVQATKTVYDHQYAAMVMQYVYYVYPSWIPDYNGATGGSIIIPPQGNWEDWQTRSDTVKYLKYQLYPETDNYTKEPVRQVQTQLDIAGGTFVAPTNIYNNDKTTHEDDVYVIRSVCSEAYGTAYPRQMQGSSGSEQLWEWKIPYPDSYQIAWFWATRSVLGADSSKQSIYLNGDAMDYTGQSKDKMTPTDILSLYRAVTFLGEL